MDRDLQNLLEIEASEPPHDQTQAERIAREARTACNGMSDEERKHYLEIAMSSVYGTTAPHAAASNRS
jgi:hypothetical protein